MIASTIKLSHRDVLTQLGYSLIYPDGKQKSLNHSINSPTCGAISVYHQNL